MKRVTTGANMASAMLRWPNRNGPPDSARHSRQIVHTRSISAWARDQILKPGKCPFRLTGSDARRVVKPEWISPQIDQQWARWIRSAGSRPGTRIDEDNSRISARADASSGAVMISSNSSPENLVSSQPRSDQDE